MTSGLSFDKETMDNLIETVREHSTARRKDTMWRNIRNMAETDPVLNEMLESCIIYYQLKKDNGET